MGLDAGAARRAAPGRMTCPHDLDRGAVPADTPGVRRGRGRSIASALVEALRTRPAARSAALAAAFAEACGRPLGREVVLQSVTRDGRLVVVARSQAWADQVVALGPAICAKVNARLGAGVAAGLDVRVGSLRA